MAICMASPIRKSKTRNIKLIYTTTHALSTHSPRQSNSRKPQITCLHPSVAPRIPIVVQNRLGAGEVVWPDRERKCGGGVDVWRPCEDLRVVGVAVHLVAVRVEDAAAHSAVVGLELADDCAVKQVVHVDGLVVRVEEQGLLAVDGEGKDDLALAVVDNLRVADELVPAVEGCPQPHHRVSPGRHKILPVARKLHPVDAPVVAARQVGGNLLVAGLVLVQGQQTRPRRANVPHLDLVVQRARGQDVLAQRRPGQGADLARVALQRVGARARAHVAEDDVAALARHAKEVLRAGGERRDNVVVDHLEAAKLLHDLQLARVPDLDAAVHPAAGEDLEAAGQPAHRLNQVCVPVLLRGCRMRHGPPPPRRRHANPTSSSSSACCALGLDKVLRVVHDDALVVAAREHKAAARINV
eukprot:m.87879 g.87879  ORF g.87879 m.87879 type:complete len:412 (+) comp15149_c0_seq2:813-2048(+)